MKQLSKYFLNFLIVGYLCIIYFSGVPETNTLNARLKQKTTNLAFILGIWPSWSMFAPNPVKFDTKSYVQLTYKNGEVREYDVETEPKGILAPFRKARWMKYAQDNLRNPNQRGLLYPAINHFKHKYQIPGNPVVNVQIKRKWKEIHPFSNEDLPSIYHTPRYPKTEVLISQQIEE